MSTLLVTADQVKKQVDSWNPEPIDPRGLSAKELLSQVVEKLKEWKASLPEGVDLVLSRCENSYEFVLVVQEDLLDYETPLLLLEKLGIRPWILNGAIQDLSISLGDGENILA